MHTNRYLRALGVIVSVTLMSACGTQDGGDATGSMTLGGEFRGEITSASPASPADGHHYQRVGIDLDAGEVVNFTLSGALDGALTLFGPDDEFLASSAGGDEDDSTSLIHRVEHTGRHFLTVAADRGSFGPYRVSAGTLDSRDGGDITAGERVAGWLDGRQNSYQFQVSEAGIYRITMRTGAFDAYLKLSGPNTSAEDDDGGGGTNAQLSSYLEPGNYQVRATAFDANSARGLYTLDIEREPLPEGMELQHGGELALDRPVNGWMSGSPVDFQLTLNEPAMVTIDMTSDDMDTHLTLTGDNDVHFEDDDGGDGFNARLQALLEPGTYTVRAGSVGGSGGLFVLQAGAVSQQEMMAETTPLSIGETVSARLAEGARDRYRLTIETPGSYTIDMTSGDLDAYLEVDGPGVSVSDDDGGSDSNARIETRLEPGDYLVTARAFSEWGSGSYEIRVSRD